MTRQADEVLVELTNASRRYGKNPQGPKALDRASCVVTAGAAIAVVGRSGSGKSTLLHLMAGLDDPTDGTVTWPAFGHRPVSVPGALGIIFQGPSLLPPLDVLENAALPLILSGTEPASARIRAEMALASVGLAGFAPRLPEELSGGQAQRVALARVLTASPRLILADEPTGQLDAENAANVMDLLLECARRIGAALVVSTHDLTVADRLASRWTVTDGHLNTGGKA